MLPSLPGYGFSARPARPLTTRDTAATWHALMRGLGYARYGAHGGDFGAAVTTFMALDEPAPLLGTPMPSGGHFAAAEEPDLLAGALAEFFGELAEYAQRRPRP